MNVSLWVRAWCADQMHSRPGRVAHSPNSSDASRKVLPVCRQMLIPTPSTVCASRPLARCARISPPAPACQPSNSMPIFSVQMSYTSGQYDPVMPFGTIRCLATSESRDCLDILQLPLTVTVAVALEILLAHPFLKFGDLLGDVHQPTRQRGEVACWAGGIGDRHRQPLPQRQQQLVAIAACGGGDDAHSKNFSARAGDDEPPTYLRLRTAAARDFLPSARLHGLHAPWQLLRSITRSGATALGTMWLTVVLMWVHTPGRRTRHVGSSRSTLSRSRRHGREPPRVL